jgi:acetoin utilization deacetylase AcuC-like enzyme
MTTALVYDPIFLEHLVPPGHPERPQRVEMSMEYVKALKWLERDDLVLLAPRAASIDELATVHERAYIREVENASKQAAEATLANGTPAIIEIGTDTYASAKTYEAATKAAGATLTAIDALMKGEVKNAYCLVRPPGHHAVAEAAFGFCVFNNVAVAARYAIEQYGLERIMIIDYDVHHGNGTQEMFYDDPRVLYFSIHQSPFFPGTGLSDEMGEGAGEGSTINIPLPVESGFEIYEPLFRQILAPVADRFDPQLILVSAGFDAHWKEAESQTGLQSPGMRLSIAGFAKLNEIILKLAATLCDGKVIMVQEGGYDLQVIASGAATCINQLLGGDEAVDSYGPAPDIKYQINTDVLIGELRRIHHLTGYRMRNQPKPDIEKLRREIKGPAASTPAQAASAEDTASCCQESTEAEE